MCVVMIPVLGLLKGEDFNLIIAGHDALFAYQWSGMEVSSHIRK